MFWVARGVTGDQERYPEAGIVKHFKWRPQGKVRLHQKPNAEEIGACRPWLDQELALLRPRVLVCLGATAAQAILGRDFRVTRQRGEVVGGALDVPVVATMHPSSVLRAGDDRDDACAGLVEDLQVVAGLL